MKKLSPSLALLSFAVCLILIVSVRAQLVTESGKDGVSPTLRGDDAVVRLKQDGQYDSLMDAFKAVRDQSPKMTELPADDATGESSRLNAADGAANDLFGISVAIHGDTAIIGAYTADVGASSDQGAAYIFVRTGTVWSQQQKLIASDGAPFDNFGWAVAISGETVVIGSKFDDIGANANQGSAYVFVRSGTVWTEQQKLTAALGGASDNFGYSVAIAGETVVAGAYLDDVGASADQGSATVFVRSGTLWTEQQQLIASDGTFSDQFGLSVAISGETVIVGSYLDDVGPNSGQGSAYVFVRSGSIWSQQQQLTVAGGAADDNFGYAVSISGDSAIVSAVLDDVGANLNQGSAYVFTRSGSTWTLQQQLTSVGGAAGDQFGISVAISGDSAIVGANSDDVGAILNQGSAYIYSRVGVTWTQQQQITGSNGSVQDQFGISVAISGSTLIVGAWSDDVSANINQGSAFVFRVLGSGWNQETRKVAADGAAGDFFGYSVAISSDTAIVGAPLDDVGVNSNQGSAFVFVRTGTNWTLQQQLFASDGAQPDQFGWSVAIYGDTIVVGAHLDNVGAVGGQGSAYVFVRSGTTWTEQQKLTASDGATDDRFGYSVAISGDTVIVGSYLDNVGATSNQGSAYVFTRSGVTWTQQAQLVGSDGAVQDQFGQSVSIFGNTAVVAAAFKDVGANVNQGQVYVFTRNGSTWTQQQILTASDAAAQDTFGNSVSISGDTLVVGAPFDDVGVVANQGSVYVFTRAGAIWSEQQKATATGGATSDSFGISVSLDGDAFVAGANGDDVGANSNQGSAFVFTRTAGVWTQQQQLTASGGSANDQFGNSVAISGDKIIVGAPFSDETVSDPLIPDAADQGAAFIFVNQPFVPTAANVSVSGRVLTSDGRGLRNAIVSLTDSFGTTRSVRTSTFGRYRFTEVEAGQLYTITVSAKSQRFVPQILTVGDDVTDFDIFGMP